MFLASTPTGVGQAAAEVIQLALSAFGAAGMVEGGVEAVKRGGAWLTTAWTANGKPELIAEASKEFLRMLVAIAVAALDGPIEAAPSTICASPWPACLRRRSSTAPLKPRHR
jgi:hypothetical protein